METILTIIFIFALSIFSALWLIPGLYSALWKDLKDIYRTTKYKLRKK